jgi:hypothetical protein
LSQSRRNDFEEADPFGFWRAYRDAGLEAWAASMARLVASEEFAQALGAQIDASMALTGPLQEFAEQYMEQYLAGINMPSRGEVTRLAERLTNIELRLDDLDARTETMLTLIEQQMPRIADMLEHRLSSTAEEALERNGINERLRALEERSAALQQLLEQPEQNGSPITSRPRHNNGGMSPEE